MLRVTVHGRRREMGLGGYPTVGIAEARKLSERWRSMAASGRDPIKERKAERRAARREDISLSILTDDAVAAFADAVEQAQGAGGSLAHITGTASKVAEQACHIAGVLTLWQDINAVEVRMAEMESGVALAKCYLSEASRLASAAVVSAEIDNAEKLRRWLLDRWAEPEVLVRDVVQLGPNALRETPKARAALGMLEKHGWLVALEAGTVVRGAARKEAWRVLRGG